MVVFQQDKPQSDLWLMAELGKNLHCFDLVACLYSNCHVRQIIISSGDLLLQKRRFNLCASWLWAEIDSNWLEKIIKKNIYLLYKLLSLGYCFLVLLTFSYTSPKLVSILQWNLNKHLMADCESLMSSECLSSWGLFPSFSVHVVKMDHVPVKICCCFHWFFF